jgi:hypothetical protein
MSVLLWVGDRADLDHAACRLVLRERVLWVIYRPGATGDASVARSMPLVVSHGGHRGD